MIARTTPTWRTRSAAYMEQHPRTRRVFAIGVMLAVIGMIWGIIGNGVSNAADGSVRTIVLSTTIPEPEPGSQVPPTPAIRDSGQCSIYVSGIVAPGKVTIWQVMDDGFRSVRTSTTVRSDHMIRDLVIDAPEPGTGIHLVLERTGLDDTATPQKLDSVLIVNDGACNPN